jgi:hypothetical protein
MPAGLLQPVREQVARALQVARGSRGDLREVLRDHAHAAHDLGDALLGRVQRVAVAQRLVDRAVADREHDRGDEHRDHDFDERETARAHQRSVAGGLGSLTGGVPGLFGGLRVPPGDPGVPGVSGLPLPGAFGPPGPPPGGALLA